MFYSSRLLYRCFINNKPGKLADMSVIVLKSKSAESAHKKALQIGKQGESKDGINEDGEKIENRLLGIMNLQPLNLKKFAENERVFYEYGKFKDLEKEFGKLILPKESLEAFQ